MLLAAQKPVQAPTPRGLRRAEYDVLVEQGILEGQRVELFGGELIEMAPQKHAHASAVRFLSNLLSKGLGDRAHVLVQCPLALSDDSEPEPDIALVDPQTPHRHPTTAWLVVEVAESSLYYDRGQKLRGYARAGIAEYWVVSTDRRCIYCYRDPLGEDYLDQTTIKEGEGASPLAFADVSIPVSALFEPR